MTSVLRIKKTGFVLSVLLLNLVIATVVHLAWNTGHQSATAAPQTIAVVTEEEKVIQAVEKNSPAVVSILVKEEQDTGPQFQFDQFGNVQRSDSQKEMVEVGRGTGFLVSSSGLIVTNRHVVVSRNAQHTVFLSDDRKFEATVLDIDPVNDLALMKIEGEGFPSVELETNDNFRIGQTVIAIGNALGRFDNTVTRGILSAVGRNIEATNFSTGAIEQLEEVLQTDAAINSGNSGGPLINLSGRVIGVNTAVEHDAQGLGFAIQASEVRNILASYASFGAIARPRLGVRYFAITADLAEKENLPYNDGAWVDSGEDGTTAVIPGGPGDIAGILDGDIILEVDGIALKGRLSLSKEIQAKNVGDRISLKIARNGTIVLLTATLDAHAPVGF